MIEVVKDPSGLWRVKNAPLISTGIEYPLASGPATFTEQMLMDAVAAQKDPAIVGPRIKLGHTSDYNEALIGDAEMAFGRIDAATMKMGDNNQTIFGDYLVPEWLGMVMPIAFPNRSIEGNQDVETATGKMYELVITAVSLLGIYWPGCQVLEDLPLWFGGDIPDGVEFDDAIAAQLAASQVTAAKGGKMPNKVRADADTSRIRRQFYDRAMANELEGVDENTYWWWIRAERFGDGGSFYLIAEDEENGDLYKFDVTVSGDAVDFSAPSPVVVEYVEKTAAAVAAVVAGMALADNGLVVHASRADSGGPAIATRRGASNMDEAKRKALAASLGLAEDATEDQIKAKLKAVRAAADDAGVADEEDPAPEPKPDDAPPAPKPDEEPAPEPKPDTEASVVSVDKDVWAQTQADAKLARDHENERISARQLGKVEAAIKATKIPPARKAHYVSLMAADEEGTTALLDSLQTGAVPVGERGSNGDGESGDLAAGQGVGLPDDWFPEIAEKKARIAAGRQPVVTQAKEG